MAFFQNTKYASGQRSARPTDKDSESQMTALYAEPLDPTPLKNRIGSHLYYNATDIENSSAAQNQTPNERNAFISDAKTSQNCHRIHEIYKSHKSEAATCDDLELLTYNQLEFTTVARIVELCYQRAQRLQNQVPKSPKKIFEQLLLIQAYEQTLRNQGTLPAEDSRVYKLLFRVVKDSEDYLEQIFRVTDLTAMTIEGRKQIMLKCLQSLNQYNSTKDLKNHQKDSTEGTNQTLNNESRKDMCQPKNQPLDIQTGIETITEIEGPHNKIQPFSTNPTSTRSQAVLSKAFCTESSNREFSERPGISTQKIGRLDLKPVISNRFKRKTIVELASEPPTQEKRLQKDLSHQIINPNSQRQINNQIAELHMNQFPSFDRDRKISEESQEIQPKTHINLNDIDTQSDKYIETIEGTEEKKIQRVFVRNENVQFYGQQTSQTQQTSYVETIENSVQKDDQPVSRQDAIQAHRDEMIAIHSTLDCDLRSEQRDQVLTLQQEPAINSVTEHHQSIMKEENPYKIVLSCFRAWQKFLKLCKHQRAMKKLLLTGLMKAISLHQFTLIKKTFISFKQSISIRNLNDKKIRRLNKIVAWNTKKEFFGKMIQVLKLRKLMVYKTKVAQKHQKRQTKSLILSNWRQFVSKNKNEILKFQENWEKKPQAMHYALLFVGFCTLSEHQLTQFDITEFYSTILQNQICRPQERLFGQTIALALKARMHQIIAHWRAYSSKFKAFREQRNDRLKRTAFKQIDRHCIVSMRLRIFCIKRERKIKEQAILGFLQNLEKSRRLAYSYQQVSEKHQLNQVSTMFVSWFQLFRVYERNQGIFAPFRQKTRPLQIIHLHKMRIFKRLKRHTKESKQVSRQIKQQQRYSGLKLVADCLDRLKKFSQKRVNARRIHLSLSKKHDELIKISFFKGIKRACMIRQRQRAYREYVLMAKGIMGLTRRVDYKRMVKSMTIVCEQKYSQSLIKRTLSAFKQSFQASVLRIDRGQAVQSQLQQSKRRLIWSILINYSQTKKQKRVLRQEIIDFYNNKIQKVFIFTLYTISKKKRQLEFLRQKFILKHQKQIYREIFQTMQTKYIKKSQLRMIQAVLEQKQVQKLQSKYFGALIIKYSSLKIAEQRIVQQYVLGSLKTNFSAWKSLFEEKCIENELLHQKQPQIRHKKLARVFKRWIQFREDKIDKRKMKGVSSQFFQTKILKKTLDVLRTHSKLQKLNSVKTSRAQRMILSDCFDVLRYITQRKILAREFRDEQQHKLLNSILTQWQSYVHFKKTGQLIVTQFLQQQSEAKKLACFLALKQEFTLKTKLVKIHKMTVRQKVFDKFQEHVQKQKQIREIKEEIFRRHQVFVASRYLKIWKEELFSKMTTNSIAEPFQQVATLKKCFQAWRKVIFSRLLAKNHVTLKLLKRGFESMCIITNLSKMQKQMTKKFEKSNLKRVFEELKYFVAYRKSVKEIGKLVSDKQSLKCKEHFYSHWKSLSKDFLFFKPMEKELKSQVREKWLLRLSFASLKRYLNIRAGKRAMLASIQTYYREQLLEKTFKQLVDYTDHRLDQNERQDQADIYLKQIQFRRFKEVVNELVFSREGKAIKFNETQLEKKTIDGFLRNVSAQKQKRELELQASRYFQLQIKEKVFKTLRKYSITTKLNKYKTVISLREKGNLRVDFRSLKFGNQLSKKQLVLSKIKFRHKLAEKKYNFRSKFISKQRSKVLIQCFKSQTMKQIKQLYSIFGVNKRHESQICLYFGYRAKRISQKQALLNKLQQVQPASTPLFTPIESSQFAMQEFEEQIIVQEEQECFSMSMEAPVWSMEKMVPKIQKVADKAEARPLNVKEILESEENSLNEFSLIKFEDAGKDEDQSISRLQSCTQNQLQQSQGQNDESIQSKQDGIDNQMSEELIASGFREGLESWGVRQMAKQMESLGQVLDRQNEADFLQKEQLADQSPEQISAKDQIEDQSNKVGSILVNRDNNEQIIQEIFHQQTSSFGLRDKDYNEEKTEQTAAQDELTMPSFRDYAAEDPDQSLSAICDDDLQKDNLIPQVIQEQLTSNQGQSSNIDRKDAPQSRLALKQDQLNKLDMSKLQQGKSEPKMSNSNRDHKDFKELKPHLYQLISPRANLHKSVPKGLSPVMMNLNSQKRTNSLCQSPMDKEIEAEMQLYEKAERKAQLQTPQMLAPLPNSTRNSASGPKSWLQKTIQSRIERQSAAQSQNLLDGNQSQITRSLKGGNAANNSSFLSVGSFGSHDGKGILTKTDKTHGGRKQENKILQNIQENLSFLNMSAAGIPKAPVNLSTL